MKKLFTLLTLLLVMATTASAQGKKTWDFSQGWSEETIADLQADTKNWVFEYNDDGSIKAIKENAKLTGDFIANGNYIKELIGLTRGTAGLSKNNNYLLTQKTFRLNRDKQEIIFPKLANGQTITIKGKSANATAENRGIKAAYDYMQLIEGPEDCLVRASLGEVTLKWKVVTDSPDSVDIKFTMITGGVDFTLFQIDEGDIPEIAEVAYLYNGTQDAIYNLLSNRESTNFTPIDVTSTSVTAEELQKYDVTVIGASVPADNAAVAAVKEAMPWTPMLNLNASLYAAWGYGETTSSSAFIRIKDGKSKLFTNVDTYEDVDEDENVTNVIVLSKSGVKAQMQAVTLGEYFEGDAQPGMTMDEEPLTAIHTHNANHNGYIYLPYVEDYTDAGLQLVENAVNMLQSWKKDITPATKPTVNIEYKDLKTNVTIKPANLPKSKVYYTIDGTEPTTESTLYTEMFTLTEETTVKAVAIAEGYTLSPVTEKLVDIKSQPKTPVISWTEQGDHTVITISGEGYGDDVKVYYNFASELTTDTLKSTVYSDTIPVIITMPQDVTAFAVAGGAVWSEVAQQRVLVENPRVVIDVAAHYSAPQWTAENNPEGKAVANGKGMFSWGASAATMYIGEGTTVTTTDPESGDEITETLYTDEDLRPAEVVNEPGENPQWVLKSRGTCLIWQNLTPQTTNFGNDSNYNPMFSTDVDPLFPVSKNAIQFYKFFANETPNGVIETLNKYQAPLDVVVLANMAGGPLVVQVSADSLEWTTIGQMEKSGKARMWNKGQFSYNGTDKVYVRLTEEVASAGPKVFDIYIASQGEKSLELLQQLKDEYEANKQGISDTSVQPRLAAPAIYNLRGERLSQQQHGLNIVVGTDGTVKKVLVK